MFVTADNGAMRAWSKDQSRAGRSIGFVPTMGCLHSGHLALIETAKEKAEVVVVSIYVNETQFAAHEDFGTYPRQHEQDLDKLKSLGCDAVFVPRAMYAPDGSHETFVQVEELQKGLCGISRPHFFRGVATIVLKLIHVVCPDLAVFGKKDYQQFVIIRKMVRDLDLDVVIFGAPIVRESDGLAMSSRNLYLSPENRLKAPRIYEGMITARNLLLAKQSSVSEALSILGDTLKAIPVEIDYVEIVDASSLQRVDNLDNDSLLVLAVYLDGVRLIDNVELF